LGAAFVVSGNALAVDSNTVEIAAVDAPVVNVLDEVAPAVSEPVQLAQITSITELSDVRPTDWAYSALQNLVETYGCIQGFPNRTFRGAQAMTRYEFAAGLNSCLNKIVDLIGIGGVSDSDLATIRRLQEQFQAELATLRGRVDALEADVAELQAQQFSTTTKLRGEVSAHLGVPFDTIPSDTSATFVARARLNFDTSFTGKDTLRIRLQSSNGNAPLSTNFGGYADASGNGGSNFNLVVNDFYYRFPVGERLRVIVAANDIENNDYVTSTIVPFDGPSVGDAGGPQFYDAGTVKNGSGLGISYALTPNIVLDAGYSVDSGTSGGVPTVGLFSGTPATVPNQTYIGQLSYISDGLIDIGFAYLHSDGGSAFAGGTGSGLDTFAGLLNLDFGGFMLGGHFAYSTFTGGNDTSFTAGIAIPDLFAEGAQLGIYGGLLPQLVGAADNPIYVEGYYDLPINEFFSITPAVIYGDNKLTATTDDTVLYGVIRTTFRF
jgi:hypothetical protein